MHSSTEFIFYERSFTSLVRKSPVFLGKSPQKQLVWELSKGFIFHNEIPNINHSLFPEYGWSPKNFPSMCFTLLPWHPLPGYRCRWSVLVAASPNSLSNRIPLGTCSRKSLDLTCSSSPPCVLTPRLNLTRQCRSSTGSIGCRRLYNSRASSKKKILWKNIQLFYTQNTTHNK